MKVLWGIVLSLLAQRGLSDQPTVRLCNSDLLFSYGIKNPRYLNQKSMYCGGSSEETCCDHIDTVNNLSRWNNENRNLIKPFFESYIWLTQALLNYYRDVLVLAKFMYNDSEFNDSCRASAEKLVMRHKTTEELIQYVQNLKKYFAANGFLRKGFYCSLCSLNNQKYFVKDSKTVIYSEEFCSSLVQISIGSVYYHTAEILRDFQLMSEVMTCKEKEQTPIRIELESYELEKVEKCFESFTRFKDPKIFLHDCQGFCKEFQISSASNIFEGNVSALSDLYDLIDKSDIVMTDPIFDEINPGDQFDFVKLKRQFFDFTLGFEDLGKYSVVIEPYGLNLFSDARSSLFFYGPHNSIEQIRKSISKVLAFLAVFAIALIA